MKRMVLWFAVVLAIFLGWTFFSTKSPRSAGADQASAARPPGGATHGNVVPTDAPPASVSDEPETNQRSRPEPRPEDKKHPVPATPVAVKVKGTPGFVMSPFNDKIIDVTGMPPGTLVQDPTYPAEEKRYFRVP